MIRRAAVSEEQNRTDLVYLSELMGMCPRRGKICVKAENMRINMDRSCFENDWDMMFENLKVKVDHAWRDLSGSYRRKQ
jgi:hypothetical protein